MRPRSPNGDDPTGYEGETLDEVREEIESFNEWFDKWYDPEKHRAWAENQRRVELPENIDEGGGTEGEN